MTILNNTYFIDEAIKEARKSPMKNQYGALLKMLGLAMIWVLTILQEIYLQQAQLTLPHLY